MTNVPSQPLNKLRDVEPRLVDINDDRLLELFWAAHPRFNFIKTLPWGAHLIDIGAGSGGLGHWKGWGSFPRQDLKLYGVDLAEPEFGDLYDGWERIDLDLALPEFPGVPLDAFFSTHLIEHLAKPERLIEWICWRARIGSSVYLEWPNPEITLALPSRADLSDIGIDVVVSNFRDDSTHLVAPDLLDVLRQLEDGGFFVITSGVINLGILGEEMFARAPDAGTRTMGYWSMTNWCVFVSAVKHSKWSSSDL